MRWTGTYTIRSVMHDLKIEWLERSMWRLYSPFSRSWFRPVDVPGCHTFPQGLLYVFRPLGYLD